MSKTRSKFSSEYRPSILKKCEREGQAVTYRKYNLPPSMVSSRKQNCQSKGLESFKPAVIRLILPLNVLDEVHERKQAADVLSVVGLKCLLCFIQPLG